MSWWANMKSIYDFRRWPLYISYEKFYRQFGFDAANYFSVLWQISALYMIIYFASTSLSISYMLADHKEVIPIGQNLDPMLDLIPYQQGRALVWAFVLALVVVWGRFIGYQHQIFYANEESATRIEDVSVALMNIPRSTTDEEIHRFLSDGNTVQVVKYLRIGTPDSIKLRKKYFNMNIHHKDVLSEFAAQVALADQRLQRSKFNGSSLLPFLQILGFFRNEAYYHKKLAALRAKIISVEANAAFDAAVLTFNSPNAAFQAIELVNTTPLKNAQMHAIKAPKPDDIYMENLVYDPMAQILRFCLTIFIVAAASLSLFGIVCWFRYCMRNFSIKEKSYVKESVIYYSFFLLTYVADGVFRPILYWAQGFERHYSFTSKEKFWFMKLYVYQVLNKLAIFYSRTLMFIGSGQITSVFDIFGYTSRWRNETNQGGSDAKFYIWVVVFGYNLLDIVIFAFYHTMFGLLAKTKREKLKANKNLPPRFASKYVYLLVVLTFVLSFGHLEPVIIVRVILYFPIQSVVFRFITLRVSAQCVKTNALTKQFENYVYVSALIGGVCLCQSYHQIDQRQGYICLFTIMPCLGLLVYVCKVGVFDRLLKFIDKRFKFILGHFSKTKSFEKMETDTEEMVQDDRWYEIARPAISEQEMLHNSRLVSASALLSSED